MVKIPQGWNYTIRFSFYTHISFQPCPQKNGKNSEFQPGYRGHFQTNTWNILDRSSPLCFFRFPATPATTQLHWWSTKKWMPPYLHPPRLTCPLKKGTISYFNRKYIFQPLIFRGEPSVFRKMNGWSLGIHRFYVTGFLKCWGFPNSHGFFRFSKWSALVVWNGKYHHLKETPMLIFRV